jgi:hypothetical protein
LPFKFTDAIKWDTGNLPSNRYKNRDASHVGVTELERWPNNSRLSELTRFATGKGGSVPVSSPYQIRNGYQLLRTHYRIRGWSPFDE